MKSLYFIALLSGLTACITNQTANAESSATPSPASNSQELTEKAVTTHYADMVKAHYDALSQSSHHLRDAVTNFVLHPTPETHKKAKEAWIAIRLIYGPSEAYRFYEGPIDHTTDGFEGALNAWPLDEMYIDGTGQVTKGIVDQPDRYPVINPELLATLNEVDSEKNIATGFHAIEFLLWGQDRNADSSGLRTFKDYIYGQSPFAVRRSTYLLAVTNLLVDHLDAVRDAWDAGDKSSYYNTWARASDKRNLTQMMTGMATLVYFELAGERMFTALDEEDQEHEHSCFSDMTHIDTMGNLLGAENVYRGQLTHPDFQAPHGEDFHVTTALPLSKGPSLRDYLATHSAARVQSLDAKFADAKQKVAAIPTPFDQAIVSAKIKILDAVKALRQLGLEIQQAGSDLGLEVGIGAAGEGD